MLKLCVIVAVLLLLFAASCFNFFLLLSMGDSPINTVTYKNTITIRKLRGKSGGAKNVQTG